MNGKQPRISTATPTPKLKDSCDTCAASKIRCDKRKPICSRCERLGYPCLYRPTRRKGYARPRRVRTETASKTSINASGASAGGSVGQQIETDLRRDSTWSSLNTAGSVMPMDATQSLTMSGCRNDTLDSSCDATVTNSKRSATAGGKLCSRTDSINSVRRSDCVTVAMDTVLQLELAKIKFQLQQGGPSINDINHAREEQGDHILVSCDPLETVTAAFRTLLTILVCPCFESQDTGLIAAAVCLSILDVYSTIVRDSAARSAEPPVRHVPTTDLSCILAADEGGYSDFRGPGYDANTSSDPVTNPMSTLIDPAEERYAADRVLEDLPKAARIVLQLTKRYGGEDAKKHFPSLFEDLAQLLKVRLQSITLEAAV